MNPGEIRLDALTRSFGARRAVDAVSLTMPAGKVTALLGASGSGKSTLLRLIAGLEAADAGRILIEGEPVSGDGVHMPPERRRIGMVFQDFALFPHLTVEQNVAFGLASHDREARARIVRRWLSEVAMETRLAAYPHELSGGEQQRVALARALAPEPRAILLDEPFSGLDPGLRSELRDRMLAAIATLKATTVFVTHDADEAMLVADRIAIMREGRLVQAGDPREVYEQPRSAAAAAALGPVNRFRGTAADGRMDTPFSVIAAPGLDGPAEAVVRAEALDFATDGRTVRVLERRPQGAFDLVRIGIGDVQWRMLARPQEGPPAGQDASIVIRPAGAFVFPLA